MPEGSFQLETGFTYGKEESHYLLRNTMDYGRMNSLTGIMPVAAEIVLSQQGFRTGLNSAQR